MGNFIVGDVARISLEIRNTAGTLADPSSLAFYAKAPNLAVIDRSSEIVRDDAGLYHFDLQLDSAGSYGYRWQSTGENQGVEEGTIYVYPQRVV